jgi:predicted Zn-dependent protease
MKSFILFFSSVLLFSCSKVPVSGRRQMHILPESELIQMASQQYDQFISQSIVLTDTENSKLVEKVGRKISLSVEEYLHRHGYSKRLNGFEWEFKLIQDPIVNAWCMPGGKICVYTGILDITQDETGLAVVMGHEVAHAIARHGNERMSKSIAAQMGGIALGVALNNKTEQTQRLFNQAYGLGSGLSGLAFSRKNELESDKLGLVFMQLAGYDASKAIGFWQRMAANGQKSPEFLSTHPSDDKRVKEISTFLESDKFKNHIQK